MKVGLALDKESEPKVGSGHPDAKMNEEYMGEVYVVVK